MRQELLTVAEIAKQLKVPLSWVYIKSREKGANGIPKIRVGKYLRFDPEQVMDWLKRNSKDK